jgi:hypothetical protein
LSPGKAPGRQATPVNIPRNQQFSTAESSMNLASNIEAGEKKTRKQAGCRHPAC